MAPNSQLQEAGAEAEAEGVAFNQARRLRLVKRRELLALDYLLSLHTVFTYMYIYKVTLWQALAQSKELARELPNSFTHARFTFYPLTLIWPSLPWS